MTRTLSSCVRRLASAGCRCAALRPAAARQTSRLTGGTTSKASKDFSFVEKWRISELQIQVRSSCIVTGGRGTAPGATSAPGAYGCMRGDVGRRWGRPCMVPRKRTFHAPRTVASPHCMKTLSTRAARAPPITRWSPIASTHILHIHNAFLAMYVPLKRIFTRFSLAASTISPVASAFASLPKSLPGLSI